MSALNVIREKNPDVVLLDNVMPNLDGIGFMKHLNNMSLENKPKVVAVTVCPTHSFVSAMYNLNAEYIMSKDNDVKDIVERCVMVANDTENSETLADNESLITSAVCAVGIPARFKGYPFLRTSIDIVIRNPNAIHSITKKLYPTIAKKYNTTPNKVERNIRNAIEVAWDRGDLDTLQRFFGYTVSNTKGKPTNSEFIALIADKLQLQLKSSEVANF